MMDLAIPQRRPAPAWYKKPIQELARAIHYEPLPGEVRAGVIAVWQRGELLPKAAIEELVPSQIGSIVVDRAS